LSNQTNLNKPINEKENEIFLLVKAPKGTTLEVPEIADEEERYPH